MESKIFYGIIFLVFISTTTAFAQESIISVQTDDSAYDEGDTIVISGNVGTVIGNTPVLIQIIQGNATIIDIAQLEVAQDGVFTETILAEGAIWQKAGKYTVMAFYQEHSVKTTFTYSPKTEVPETKKVFEVDAGNHGTFDVEYSIKGGSVKDMAVNSDSFAITVQIEAPDEGTITLDLPREFIGAEKQDGKDDTFIILIDGIYVPYQESVVLADSRVITISFVEGDSDIMIIGTYIVPEFGAIAMMILIASIMTVIVLSRNKFQIKV